MNELQYEVFAATREGFDVSFSEDYQPDGAPPQVVVTVTYVHPNRLGECPQWTDYAEAGDDLGEVLAWLVHDAKPDLTA